MEFDNKLKPKGVIETIDDSAFSYMGDGYKKISYNLNGGVLDLMAYPDGRVGIVEYEVPEALRNQGIGTKLLKHALSKYPNLTGQFSSDNALKIAYNLGMRGDDETYEEALKSKRSNPYGSYFAKGR